MAIEIHPNPAFSLFDIQQARDKDGASVVRTAHVGNQRGYNLAVADAGIPMQLVDHTIVAQQPGDQGDNNYFPGSIVTTHGVTPLEVSRLGGLTLRTEVTDPASGERMFLDQFHIRSLRTAFPRTLIVTNTEYIRQHEAVSGEVVAIALEVVPELFVRAVESDGTIHKAPFGSLADRARHEGVLQLRDDPRHDPGVLIPNAVDMVLGFVVEALEYGGDYQIHLSGPDFIHYTKDPDLQRMLNTLYDAIRQRASFGMKLPETLQVHIVPATEAQYVTAKDQGEALDMVLELLAEDVRLKQEKAHFFAHHTLRDEASLQFIVEMDQKMADVAMVLGAAALAASELFVGPRSAPFTSQYDVLEHGGLYVPTINLVSTMDELRKMRLKIERARAAVLKEKASHHE